MVGDLKKSILLLLEDMPPNDAANLVVMNYYIALFEKLESLSKLTDSVKLFRDQQYEDGTTTHWFLTLFVAGEWKTFPIEECSNRALQLRADLKVVLGNLREHQTRKTLRQMSEEAATVNSTTDETQLHTQRSATLLDTTPDFARPSQNEIDDAMQATMAIIRDCKLDRDGIARIQAEQLAQKTHEAGHSKAASHWAIHELVCSRRVNADELKVQWGGVIKTPGLARMQRAPAWSDLPWNQSVIQTQETRKLSDYSEINVEWKPPEVSEKHVSMEERCQRGFQTLADLRLLLNAHLHRRCNQGLSTVSDLYSAVEPRIQALRVATEAAGIIGKDCFFNLKNLDDPESAKITDDFDKLEMRLITLGLASTQTQAANLSIDVIIDALNPKTEINSAETVDAPEQQSCNPSAPAKTADSRLDSLNFAKPIERNPCSVFLEQISSWLSKADHWIANERENQIDCLVVYAIESNPEIEPKLWEDLPKFVKDEFEGGAKHFSRDPKGFEGIKTLVVLKGNLAGWADFIGIVNGLLRNLIQLSNAPPLDNAVSNLAFQIVALLNSPEYDFQLLHSCGGWETLDPEAKLSVNGKPLTSDQWRFQIPSFETDELSKLLIESGETYGAYATISDFRIVLVSFVRWIQSRILESSVQAMPTATTPNLIVGRSDTAPSVLRDDAEPKEATVSKEKGDTRLTVDKWSELSIGIHGDGRYFAFQSKIENGSRVYLKNGRLLTLAGNQWKELLTLFSDSDSGSEATTKDVMQKFAYYDMGELARLRAVEDGTELRAAKSKIANAISDLNRKLLKEVNSADHVPKENPPMSAADDAVVRAKFTVRCLIENENGYFSFGIARNQRCG